MKILNLFSPVLTWSTKVYNISTHQDLICSLMIHSSCKPLQTLSMQCQQASKHFILSWDNPDTEIRQSPPSLDKYFESIYHFERIQLRKTSNTWSVDVDLTEDKLISTLDELSHWHKNSRSFTLLQDVILYDNFEFWANTSPWAR